MSKQGTEKQKCDKKRKNMGLSTVYLVMGTVLVGCHSLDAFVTPCPQSLKHRHGANQCQKQHAVPRAFHEQPVLSIQPPSMELKELLWNVPTGLFLADGSLDEESMAFTDDINLFDGPILAMLGVFGLVAVGLVALKALSNQMDSAIEQVLVDFEATMKASYPQRWQSDIRPLLEGLEGEERQQKLVQLMEEIQTKDPEFMGRVQQKMKG